CTQLAAHYQTLWVPEYAREYLETNGTSYTYDTLLEIAKGQVRLEDEYLERLKADHPDKSHPVEADTTQNLSAHPLLFIDTEMYVMKVWSEFVFRKCHQWIIDQAADRQYDLFLLCNIDLPWIYDVLREYPTPEPRQQLFRMYHDIMVNQPVPWVIIKGDYEDRLSSAIAAINRIL
ncbi:MAG TPA: ATP-binding protein, partial [Chitinophagaceae bacterium]